MPANVFISYSTLDLATATKAKNTLIAAGHQAYVADYDAQVGSVLSSELKTKIKEADVFVVLWSQSAKNSDWVQQEIGIAEAHNKVVVPMLLQTGMKVPGFISDRKYVEAHEDLETAILKVREKVDTEGTKKEHEDAKGWLILGAMVVVIAALASK